MREETLDEEAPAPGIAVGVGGLAPNFVVGAIGQGDGHADYMGVYEPDWPAVWQFVEDHPGGATLDEVAEIWKCSRQYIDLIEKKALAKVGVAILETHAGILGSWAEREVEELRHERRLEVLKLAAQRAWETKRRQRKEGWALVGLFSQLSRLGSEC